MILQSIFLFITMSINLQLHSTDAFSIPTDRQHVVVVGSANQDLTAYTPTMPVLGETVIGGEFETSEGGKGANQAVAAGSLNMSPVTMICRVGPDVFGQSILNKLGRCNVQWDAARTVLNEKDSPASGTATIVVDTKSGDNMIIVAPGANFALSPEQVDSSLRALPEKPAIVVVQLEIRPEAALQALKTAKELGATTVLNPAPAPEGFTLDEFYPYCDIIIPNETELRKILERPEDDTEVEEVMAKELLEKGPSVVIVTLGARGAMVVAKPSSKSDDVTVTMVDAPVDLPAREEPVQDTVGAGDAFCGSLSTYLSQQVPLTQAAGLACGVASMSVRRRGASYPTAAELPDCLRLQQDNQSTPVKPTLTFVTGNQNKLKEVEQILSKGGEIPFVLTNRKIDLPELQGSDPLEIAREKCKLAAATIQGPCLTEDTSLCFNALNGLPGPYIKWFLEKCGHSGLNEMLDGFSDRSAYAQTVMAFTSGPDEDIHMFDGRTDGMIVSPRGPLDFGWDPIFQPSVPRDQEGNPNSQTYAEMDKETKNSVSHRSRSLAKLRDFLTELT